MGEVAHDLDLHVAVLGANQELGNLAGNDLGSHQLWLEHVDWHWLEPVLDLSPQRVNQVRVFVGEWSWLGHAANHWLLVVVLIIVAVVVVVIVVSVGVGGRLGDSTASDSLAGSWVVDDKASSEDGLIAEESVVIIVVLVGGNSVVASSKRWDVLLNAVREVVGTEAIASAILGVSVLMDMEAVLVAWGEAGDFDVSLELKLAALNLVQVNDSSDAEFATIEGASAGHVVELDWLWLWSWSVHVHVHSWHWGVVSSWHVHLWGGTVSSEIVVTRSWSSPMNSLRISR